MKIKLLILLHFISVHYIYGSDVLEAPQRSKPLWLRVIRARHTDRIDQTSEITSETADQKQRRRPKALAFKEKLSLEDLEKNVAKHLKVPLPRKLIFKKTYDFFDEVPEKLHDFMRNSLNFPNFQDGAEIRTLPGWLDQRGHVTEGRIGNTKVILKRSKYLNDPNAREMFYKFIDAAKEKLRDLAAIARDHTLSEEEKNVRTQQIRRQLSGLGNIVPIVGITQIQRPDESSPGKFIDETIEILPKVNGHTLCDCIEKKLPPYDTPRGIPRNQNIAIQLLLQFTQAMLSLHSCGYIRGDFSSRNIMIAKNGPSFALKLIDWGSITKNHSDPICRKIEEIFIKILIGGQCLSEKYKLFDELSLYSNSNETQIRIFSETFSNCLNKVRIYSRKTIDTMVQLWEDILLKNDEKKPKLETIISTLEKLLNENKLRSNMAEKNNDGNSDENQKTDEDKQTANGH